MSTNVKTNSSPMSHMLSPPTTPSSAQDLHITDSADLVTSLLATYEEPCFRPFDHNVYGQSLSV